MGRMGFMALWLYGFMALWLYVNVPAIFYCIRTSEISEPKSDCNYRKSKNCQGNFSFRIIRDLFLMNCEFEFEIRGGANLHLVLKP